MLVVVIIHTQMFVIDSIIASFYVRQIPYNMPFVVFLPSLNKCSLIQQPCTRIFLHGCFHVQFCLKAVFPQMDELCCHFGGRNLH